MKKIKKQKQYKYCDNCKKKITAYQYKKGKGLCLVCIDIIN